MKDKDTLLLEDVYNLINNPKPLTFYQISDKYEKDHAHHIKKLCVECGTIHTCRCMAKKTEIKGICGDCCERLGINFQTGATLNER
jgi:hypothetical protein